MSLALGFMKGSLKKRMLWSIIGSVSIVFLFTAVATVFRVRATLIEEKQHEVELYSAQSSTLLSLKINEVRRQVEMLDISFEQVYHSPRTARRSLSVSKLKKALESSDQMVHAIWVDWEPQALDSLDAQMVGTAGSSPTGRFSCSFYRQEGQINLDKNSKSDAEVLGGIFYTGAKQSGKLTVTKPYLDDYDGGKKVLMISVSSPVIANGSFRGVVGADINVSAINSQVMETLKEQEGRFIVVDADKNIELHEDDAKVGLAFNQVLNSGNRANAEVLSAITAKRSGFYTYNDEEGKEFIAYLSETNIFNPGEISILLIPYSFISKSIAEIIVIGLLLILLALGIVYFVTVYIVRRIVLPVEKVTNVLKALGDGDFDKASHVEIKTNDEIETMATSLNSLYDSIEEVANFAETIGNGDLSAVLKSKGKGDILGNSLIKMQGGLIKASEEAKARKQEDEKQSWIERCVANFGKELRNDNGEVAHFYSKIIRLIVHDLEVNQAGLYIINDNDESNKYFEAVACMAWGREKIQKSTYLLEEGLLGACYFEKEPIVLTEIPDDFINITSGLGSAKPKVLMLVPLIHNENVIGIIEVASFSALEEHKKTYLLRVAEIFASTLVSIRVNARTNELLTISQMQAEEMAAQEEEMRQNLEELHATQEEMKRKTQKAELMHQAVEESFITITVDRRLTVVDLNTNAVAFFDGKVVAESDLNLSSLLVESDIDALRSAVEVAVSGRVENVRLSFKLRSGVVKMLQATIVSEQGYNSTISIIGYELSSAM